MSQPSVKPVILFANRYLSGDGSETFINSRREIYGTFYFAIFRSHAPIFVTGISGWLSVHCQPSHVAYSALFFLELCLLLSCCVFLIEIVARSLRVLFYFVTLLIITFLARQMLTIVFNLDFQKFRKRATESRVGNYSPTKNFLSPLMKLFDSGLCKPICVLYFYVRPTTTHIRCPK